MIISVNSSEEAKNYPVMFNNTELMMDNNKDVFYVKAVDSLGKVSFSTYKFEKIENEKPLSPESYVTIDQFNMLTAKIDTIIKELGGISNE